MTGWAADWLRAFALTLGIEALVATPLLARADPRVGRRLAGATLANLATHPLVWFLFPALALGYPTRVALSEAFAVVLESACYLTIWPALGPRRAALVSLLANGASFGAGLLLRTQGWL